MVDYNEECGFTSYKHFIKHNKTCVEQLSYSQARTFSSLCKLIKKEKIGLVDEDNFIEWDAFAVYFNIHGKFTIMHPQ